MPLSSFSDTREADDHELPLHFGRFVTRHGVIRFAYTRDKGLVLAIHQACLDAGEVIIYGSSETDSVGALPERIPD